MVYMLLLVDYIVYVPSFREHGAHVCLILHGVHVHSVYISRFHRLNVVRVYSLEITLCTCSFCLDYTVYIFLLLTLYYIPSV